MKIRMKEKYYRGFSALRIPTKGDPVLPGCHMYEERAALAERYRDGEIDKDEHDSQLLKTVPRANGNPPTTIEMQLHHGDLVVMHGENLQKYYEVCVGFPVLLLNNTVYTVY